MKHRRFIFILLALVLLAVSASAATDYLWLYSSWFTSSAVSAAKDAEPVIKLSAVEEAAYRLGFAAGYDTASFEYESLQGNALVRASLPTEDAEIFIVNTETNKFHVPGCSSEKAILPEHRKEVHGTIEEVRQMGYSPCGRCLKGK